MLIVKFSLVLKKRMVTEEGSFRFNFLGVFVNFFAQKVYLYSLCIATLNKLWVLAKLMRQFTIMLGSVELMYLFGSPNSALLCPEIFWNSIRQIFYKKLFSNFFTITGIGDSWTLISEMTSVPPIFWDAV